MVDPQRRSLPSSSGDVQLRRLGLGKSGGATPLRGQVVVALVLGMIAIGVPLYFMRRPSTGDGPSTATSARPVPSAGIIRSTIDAGASGPRVRVAEVTRVNCGARAQARGNEGLQCDALPALESLLKRAITKTLDCAAPVGEGTINFVLNVDFPARRINVFPGKSGSWTGPQAKRAAGCVEQAMTPIKWASITHRYRFYSLAMLATYSSPSGAGVVPTFE